MTTPCIARKIIDDLGVGSILKNIHDDEKRAIIIDWVGNSPDCVAVVARVPDEPTEEPCGRFNPDLYEICVIELEEWIALTTGSDEMLIE